MAVKEWTCKQGKNKQRAKEQKLSSSSSLFRLLAEGAAQIRGVFPAQDTDERAVSKIQIQIRSRSSFFKTSESSSQVCPPFLDFS